MTQQSAALRLADALENTPNWQKEEWNSDWKSSVMKFSREPFEAAAALRRLHERCEDITGANHRLFAKYEQHKERVTTLEAVLKQAVEALEDIENHYMSLPKAAEQAITAAKQALEQP